MKPLKFHKNIAAKALSTCAKFDWDFRLCCCIVHNNRIESVGTNSRKTHPASHTLNKRQHAEFMAAMRLKTQKIGRYAYVARIKANGAYGLARPCPECCNVLRDVGVRHVWYTTNADGVWSNCEL